MKTGILLCSCPDAKGIVARTTGFIYQYGGNLMHADHHADKRDGTSFLRLEWELESFSLDPATFPAAFGPIAADMNMTWSFRTSEDRPRMAILVSAQDHCMGDLLHRYAQGELPCEIPFVAGNHDSAERLAAHYDTPFLHIPIVNGDAESKRLAEERLLAHCAKFRIEVLVLARYMQVLSSDMLARIGCPVINIHHSFLPAFKGGRPYHQAAERGVKIIGATSHYVTEDLDEGPIIEQDVIRVSHRDSIEDLVRKGRDLEKLVLARAVRLHLQHRVLRHRGRTIVFS